MAGSLRHIIPHEYDDGEIGGGWSMIEDMGDAHECVEELLWLVVECVGVDEAELLLAEGFYPKERGDMEPDETYRFVKRQMSL